MYHSRKLSFACVFPLVFILFITPVFAIGNTTMMIVDYDDIGSPRLAMDELLERASELNEVINIYTSAQYPHYLCIYTLTARAHDVVRVEVLDERVELVNILLAPLNYGITEMYRIHTINRLRVLEVFKGESEAGDIIEIKQYGGKLGYINVVNPDMAPIVVGDDIVVFIGNPGIYFGIYNLPSSLLSPFQAAYRFTPLVENARMRNVNVELESVFEGNNLTLTLEDLAQISEKNQN